MQAMDWLGRKDRGCAVTDAGSAIGAAVAHGRAAIGAKAALLDRDENALAHMDEELRARGTPAVAILCDVTNEKSVAQEVMKDDGRLFPDLFTVGNDRASIMGGQYPGAGITFGPIMTFGFLTGPYQAGVNTPAEAAEKNAI